MVTLMLTLLPSVLILFVLIISDKFREPKSMILSTFILGILLCFPAGYLNGVMIWEQDEPENYTFLAGLTEETLKFLGMYFFVKNRIEFNEPMDAIIYGTLISLGFATFENFEYVYLYNDGYPSFQIALIRAVSAIPLHALCGIVMGYFFGLYAFRGQKRFLLKSLAFPIIFHGLYNFLLATEEIIVILLLCGLTAYAFKLHRELMYEQKSKSIEEESKRA